MQSRGGGNAFLSCFVRDIIDALQYAHIWLSTGINYGKRPKMYICNFGVNALGRSILHKCVSFHVLWFVIYHGVNYSSIVNLFRAGGLIEIIGAKEQSLIDERTYIHGIYGDNG